MSSADEVDAVAAVRRLIRPIEDWPAAGVTFRDVTPLLGAPDTFDLALDALARLAEQFGPLDALAGIEARGFIFGAPLARQLGLPFVPLRKPGKLPAETVSTSYDLEYGSEVLQMHADALAPGARTLVLDDVLVTGGTLAAANHLIEQVGATVAGNLVLIELTDLAGRAVLPVERLAALVEY